MEHIKNWFSNFLPIGFNIVDDIGIEYLTVENCYQAQKTLDPIIRNTFVLITPGKAKREGRKLEIRSDWEQVKVGVMYNALKQKFARGTEWHKKLMETEGPIVEFNNWHDTYWGYDVNEQKGKNVLGKLLMSIRDGSALENI